MPSGLVLGAAALSGCGIKVSMVRPTPTLVPDGDVPRVDVAAAYAQVMAGRAILIDVRGDEAYHARHAKGALSIPIEDIEDTPTAAMRVLPAGKAPILYCT